jgi:predicted DNA-binding transcriptional regulator AlpA
MSDQFRTKAVVTVTEMARMVGLSRARFYQLVNEGVFPSPVYKLSNHRPVYVESLQKVCLEVRRQNCGINGQPVLFYAKGFGVAKLPSKPNPKLTTKGQFADVLDGLRGLGLVAATAQQVEAAVKQLFPGGPDVVDRGEVIRAVFLHLKRRDTGDNVGR